MGSARDIQCSRERFFSNNLRKTKISKLDGTFSVDEKNVLWFNVAMDNITFVLGEWSVEWKRQ